MELTDGAEAVGMARTRRDGNDAVIITWGTMVGPSLAAAEALSAEQLDVGVLDLRWLNPLAEKAIVDAVTAAKGKVLIVHEAVRTGGFAAEIAMRIRELVPEMDVRISRLTTPDVRMPSSPVLQKALLPNAQTIAEAVRAIGG
ncbi:transketolase C-terminal domain-containing protein [Mesorhizobium newzealandense]|uniref:Transketolase C-terminal domain-containing protein n=2 Tax=Mesorhizobium TaxID=68287 RepID=A0ABW4WAJ0_9HYPH|nr:transketolase C-terminal domain-containing protein [Mesorhizobium sophorae]